MGYPLFSRIDPKVFIVEGPPGSGVTDGLLDFTKAFVTSADERGVLFLTDDLTPEKILYLLQEPVPEFSGRPTHLSKSLLSRITVRKFSRPDDVTPPAILEILSASKPTGMIVIDSLRLREHDIPRARWLLFELSVKVDVEVAVGFPKLS